MFDHMRKHAPTYIIITIIAFIGTIFLVWGMGGDQEKRSIVATINGQPISLAQYRLAYANKRQFYRNAYKNRFTAEMEKELNLKQQTLDDLITRHLLIEQSHEEGLSITNDELKNRIRNFGAFQENGVFSSRLYRQVLSANRLNPSQFEENERQDMLISKITSLIKDQVKVSKAEWLEEYKQSNEKIKVKYLLFSSELYEEQVTLTDNEITSYFNAHKEGYRQPQRRKVKYLLLNARNLQPEKIKDEEIKEYYENNLDKYKQSHQIRARHILLKIAPNASEKVKEEAKKKAEKLLARIKKGEAFADLATEFSEDPGSAKKGGDLGYFSRGQMVPNFEKVAFSLVRGEVSNLVETNYGYHIIKVLGVKEEYTETLQEVSSDIERKLKRERSETVGEELAEETYLQLSEGNATWQEIADRAEWNVKESNFFGAQERVSGIYPDNEFKNAAFQLIQQEISAPVKINTGFALLQLLEEKESYLPELEEVKDKAENALKKDKAAQIAKNKAEKATEQFKQGTALEKLAKDIEAQESEFVDRRGFIPQIGRVATFAADLFALDKGQLSSALLIERGTTKSYAIFLLEDKQAADEKNLETEGEPIRARLLSIKQEQRLQSWVAALREQSEVEINQKLID